MGPNVASMHGLVPALQPLILKWQSLQFQDRRQAPITVISKAAVDVAWAAVRRGGDTVVQRRQKRRERRLVRRKLSPGPVDQLYVLFTSCASLGLGVPTLPVFSQISPVFRSLSVWSQLAR